MDRISWFLNNLPSTRRARQERWSTNETTADREVLGSIRFLQIPFLAWGTNLGLIPFQVGLLWGTWNPVGQVFFSLAAATYALLFAIKGWKPWRMATYRTFADGDSERWNRNPTARAVAEFLQSPRIAWTAAAITSSAALTPWLITGVSMMLGGTPFANIDKAGWVPPLGMALFGYADGVRAGTLAMLWMKRELRRNWESLREGASDPLTPAADRPSADDADRHSVSQESQVLSVGDFLQKRGISKLQAIVWFLIGLVVVGVLAYLRGCSRRHGF